MKECQLKVAANFAEGYSMLGLSHQDVNGKDQGHLMSSDVSEHVG